MNFIIPAGQSRFSANLTLHFGESNKVVTQGVDLLWSFKFDTLAPPSGVSASKPCWGALALDWTCVQSLEKLTLVRANFWEGQRQKQEEERKTAEKKILVHLHQQLAQNDFSKWFKKTKHCDTDLTNLVRISVGTEHNYTTTEFFTAVVFK